MSAEVRAQLQRALDHAGNTHTLEDVAHEVAAGNAQFWLNERAVIVTEVTEYPEVTELNFWLCGGDLGPVLELAEQVYRWGREQGCDRAVFTGRKGWAPVLKAHGWEPALVCYSKEL